MKVLVTGARGQVARALAEIDANEAGIELIFAGRAELDLASRGRASEAIAAVRPGAVINSAAYTAVDLAETERDQAFAVNADGAEEVARAANNLGVPIIQLSTDYVFDGRSERPYREDAPAAPLNVYGASKLAGEEKVRAGNARHLILRTSWVYSAFGSNFVKTMLRLAAERSEIRVVADQVGRPTSAHDLADVLMEILVRWRDGDPIGQGKTYHVAAEGSCSWAEFAGQIFADSAAQGGPMATVIPIATEDYPTPAARPRYSVLDTGKFRSDFGRTLPLWRESLKPVVRRLVTAG